MSENQKQQYLKQTLWNIANELRGNMDADDFRDYILGFIFYKYLSRKMESYANLILEPDGLSYNAVETHKDAEALLEAIRYEALDKLGYFLKPSELFSPSLPRDCIAWHNSLCTTGIAIIGRMRMG